MRDTVVRRSRRVLAVAARRAFGVAGILLSGASVWLAALNVRSGVVVAVLGVNAAACGLLAYWGLAAPRQRMDAESERAIIALAARTGAPLTEAEIVLETRLSSIEARGILDGMRRHGIVEIVFRDGDTLAYHVVGLAPSKMSRWIAAR